MVLTVVAVKAAKGKDKKYGLPDSGGMYLQVEPTGKKYWRMNYRFGGKQKTLALGVYPTVSLLEARGKRDVARKMLMDGVDPSEVRKVKRATISALTKNSFEIVAREWFSKHKSTWKDKHSDRIIRRLEANVFPWLGAKLVGEITAPELLTAIRRIEGRGAVDTAHRTLANCGRIFRYAIATGRAQRNTAADLLGALPPVKAKHYASITDSKLIGALLRDLSGYQGTFVTRCALRLAPLTFVRPGELRKAEWSEIDLDKAEWRIPAERMKMEAVHIIPLSTQAVGILHEIQPLTGSGRYVFPGVRSASRPMSDNTVLQALRVMGYTKEQMTGHGFRHMASTLLNEQGWNRDAIERQLAHAERDGVRAAYNYAEYMPERRRMMQAWADYLDELSCLRST